MSIFDRFLKSRARKQKGVDVRGVTVIPTKCPTCGMVGDFECDPEKHDQAWMMVLDKNTFLYVLECPYCKAGMLLCIREGHMMGIEPFKDNPPTDLLEAVARTRAKLGM